MTAFVLELPKARYYAEGDPGLDGLIRCLQAQKRISIDTETTGLLQWRDVPKLWSVAWREGADVQRACLPASTLPFFQKPVFSDPNRQWVLQNAKYDMHMLGNVGISLEGPILDVRVMHCLLYEEQDHDLKTMCQRMLGFTWQGFMEAFPPQIIHDPVLADKRKEGPGEIIDRVCSTPQGMQKMVEYAGNDAFGALLLAEKLEDELRSAKTWSLWPDWIDTLWDLFLKTEVPFTRALFNCERRGIRIDSDYMQTRRGAVVQQIAEIDKKIARAAGTVLNPNSPAQLINYFFTSNRYKPIKFTKTGNPSCDADVLEALADMGDEVAHLLTERAVPKKLLGTYIDGMSKWMDPGGRIHTHYNQDIARTGRLSSSEPNLQNLPRGEDDDIKIRNGFIAAEGKQLLVCDYEALEMRLLAAGAGEPDMIGIFLAGKDIHMGNAELVYGNPYEDYVTAKKTDKLVKEGKLPASAMTPYVKECLAQRFNIKALAFGMNYGMKEGKLARTLGCSVEEAKALGEKYLSRYPAVSDFYVRTIEDTRSCGYAFDVLGRRRFLPAIVSRNKMDRWQAERQAVNMGPQGSAAALVKLAMIQIDQARLDKHYGIELLAQVHDELVAEVPPDKDLDPRGVQEFVDFMEHAFPTDLAVPLTVSKGIGRSWGDAK